LYGRKPIVLLGLLGTVSATFVFGFSKSFAQALIARTAAGLVNGNVGVIRTMVAEMVVEKAHQARAFSVMPFVWSAGSILGPVLGGAYSVNFFLIDL
jgi:MFS family permease